MNTPEFIFPGDIWIEGEEGSSWFVWGGLDYGKAFIMDGPFDTPDGAINKMNNLLIWYRGRKEEEAI